MGRPPLRVMRSCSPQRGDACVCRRNGGEGALTGRAEGLRVELPFQFCPISRAARHNFYRLGGPKYQKVIILS